MVQSLSVELSQALNVTDHDHDQHQRRYRRRRIHVVSIDVSSGMIELLILPKSVSTAQRQWFAAYFDEQQESQLGKDGKPESEQAQSLESWMSTPSYLAHQFQRQLWMLDASRSSLFHGKVIASVDPRTNLTIRSISMEEANHILRSIIVSLAPEDAGAMEMRDKIPIFSDELFEAERQRRVGELAAVGVGVRPIERATPTRAAKAPLAPGPTAPPVSRHGVEDEEEQWRRLKRARALDRALSHGDRDLEQELNLLTRLFGGGGGGILRSIVAFWIVASSFILFGALPMLYLYWHTMIQQPLDDGSGGDGAAGGGGFGGFGGVSGMVSSSRSRSRVQFPLSEMRRRPEYNFVAWMIEGGRNILYGRPGVGVGAGREGQSVLAGAGAGSGAGRGLIDPLGGVLRSPASYGPSDQTWQQQQQRYQVPPVQLHMRGEPASAAGYAGFAGVGVGSGPGSAGVAASASGSGSGAPGDAQSILRLRNIGR